MKKLWHNGESFFNQELINGNFIIYLECLRKLEKEILHLYE